MSRLVPFVFILLAIGIFFGYVKPAWTGTIADTKNQIASYDKALDAAARFSANEAKLEEERNQIPPDELTRLNTFLPDSVDNVQLILDLNALADHAGMEISNFTTGNTPNAPAESAAADSGTGALPHAPLADSLTLSVTAKGTYDSFRSFLAGIEQSLRPLDVVSVAVTDSDTGVYTYTLTLKFYWLH